MQARREAQQWGAMPLKHKLRPQETGNRIAMLTFSFQPMRNGQTELNGGH
jgi:hypothetical protein